MNKTNIKINSLQNLVGTVSANEIKYQLDSLQEDTGINVASIKNLVGTVSDNEIKYQLENLKVN